MNKTAKRTLETLSSTTQTYYLIDGLVQDEIMLSLDGLTVSEAIQELTEASKIFSEGLVEIEGVRSYYDEYEARIFLKGLRKPTKEEEILIEKLRAREAQKKEEEERKLAKRKEKQREKDLENEKKLYEKLKKKFEQKVLNK